MGAVTSCCSPSVQNIHRVERNTHSIEPVFKENIEDPLFVDHVPTQAEEVDITDPVVARFYTLMKNGVTVTVLLQDSTELICKFTLSINPPMITIDYLSKKRTIILEEILSLFHGQQALDRVDTQAVLTEDRCVALQLLSGSCIPLRLQTQSHKKSFITCITMVMEKYVCASEVGDPVEEELDDSSGPPSLRRHPTIKSLYNDTDPTK
eukprot:Platyproteum_vivax@DN2093_c0_g1_i1.p1